MKNRLWLVAIVAMLAVTARLETLRAQGYGTDLQNLMAPASGGMAGVSVARPQDVPSAIFGNPATMMQFEGTQFTLGGAWIEGYPTVTNDGRLNSQAPGTPFTATSRAQGGAALEIGATQDLRPRGLPGVFGVGVSALSAAGAEYRGLVPESDFLNNASSEYFVLGVDVGGACQVTEQFSAGATITLGNAYQQLGFIGPITSSAMVADYGIRGTFGLTYDLNECNTVGVYYQSKLGFSFPNAVRITAGNVTTYRDVNIDQPATLGLGFANRSLMDGDLLVAADVYYKLWEDAALWQDVFVNQWAFAVGTQLTRGKMQYRLGYSYNSNPTNHSVGDNFDGIIGVGRDAVQFYQASSLPFVNQHRITGGVGRKDLLIRGLDVDFFAGGMLPQSDNFGPNNSASLAIWYIGTGLTWRYDAPREQ